MKKIAPDALKPYATKYIWWKTPDEAVQMPARVVAQVMNLGDFDDVLKLTKLVGDDYLREVLLHAEAGMFSDKSWHYWHYRLGLAKLGEVPELPKKEIGMIGCFKPKMDILPLAQQKLWLELRPALQLGFVLYGGTAIALRLGHRPSVDFDFFIEIPLDKIQLKQNFSFIDRSEVIQDSLDTLTVLVPGGVTNSDYVKVSFFGSINFGRVGEPEETEDGVLQVAALDDLMAHKLKVILQRIEAKDYRDIAALLQAGVSLEKGLAAARAFYGTQFQPSESLKAMVYFTGGDLYTLSAQVKETLIYAVSKVSNLPLVSVVSKKLSKV